MSDALRVVAHLDSPLGGDPPNLDALLVYISSRIHGKDATPGYKVDRKYPCPDTYHLPIAMPRLNISGFHVPLCTSPILPIATSDTHEHIAKRIGVEHSCILDPLERKVVTTTNGWTKSYRLPLRTRRVDRIVWLCVGDRREMLKYLRYIPAVGKKIADGYGRVRKWEIDRLGESPHNFWPWWCESESGPVLMRPLPLAWDKLPRNLLGSQRSYGACCDPYWHPDRYTDIVIPC